MEDQDKKPQEFSLEDIMREFSDNPVLFEEDAQEFHSETPAAPAPAPEPEPIVPLSTAQPASMGDTRVLPRIRVEDTIRMDPVAPEKPPAAPAPAQPMDQTQRFAPVEEPEAVKKPLKMKTLWRSNSRRPSCSGPSSGCGN